MTIYESAIPDEQAQNLALVTHKARLGIKGSEDHRYIDNPDLDRAEMCRLLELKNRALRLDLGVPLVSLAMAPHSVIES